MIKEVIVVEGKMDIQAVGRAVEADCIATGGFTLAPRTLKDIEAAYKKRGIIILTDPDTAGERIRRFLSKRFPEARHAFIPRDEATAHGDVGVEQASAASILMALEKARVSRFSPETTFRAEDLVASGLAGATDSASRRDAVGAVLGIGFANAKTFLKRLNRYGVTREEFSRVTRMAGTKDVTA